jgi:DNA end-binding protein Ku
MILHGMLYKDEVRDFNAVPKADSQRLKQHELNLGVGLVEQMSNDEFEPEKYRDEYRLRVKAMPDKKVEGQEITAAPPEPTRKQGHIIDLMEALKQSLNKDKVPAKAKPAAKQKSPRKVG